MIPPLVSLPTYEAFESALREHLSATPKRQGKRQKALNLAVLAECQALQARGLPPIASAASLGVLLGVSPRLISSMSTRQVLYWRKFTIAKKAGGERTIVAPRVFLKVMQRYLLWNVLNHLTEHEAAYGFSAGKGAYRNAQQHARKRYVWNTDITNFFPSIPVRKVHSVFRELAFPENVSWTLASLCTFQGVLPQGAPTSPRLANLVCRKLDTRLMNLAAEFNCTYTRYADDVTFSSDSRLDERLYRMVENELAAEEFPVNPNKTRLYGPAGARYVTGFVVNETIHPDRQMRRILRAKFHNLKAEQTSNLSELAAAHGWASFVHSYDRGTGRTYLEIASTAKQRALAKDAEDDASDQFPLF